MATIELPLRDIGTAPACRPDQLQQVHEELSPEDVERMTDDDLWKHHRESDLVRTLLPTLGDDCRFHLFGAVSFYAAGSYGGRDDGDYDPAPLRQIGVVVPIAGRTYRVSLRVRDVGGGTDYEATGKTLILVETDEPLTPPLTVPPARATRRTSHLKFFGQPVWVQNEHFPADPRGEPCRHLVTVENGWGDSGNWNILIGLDAAGVPDTAYFEASCC